MSAIYGHCDCCERPAFLHRVMSRSCGETFACADCLGWDAGDFDPDPDDTAEIEVYGWQFTSVPEQTK